VTYKRFDFHYSEALRGYELTLGAIAPDYRSVIEQMDTFKRKPYTTYIPSVAIEGLHPDDTGKITFNLKMPINIAGVLPEGLLLGEAGAPPVINNPSEVPPLPQTEAPSTTGTILVPTPPSGIPPLPPQ